LPRRLWAGESALALWQLLQVQVQVDGCFSIRLLEAEEIGNRVSLFSFEIVW
jgi:hypothetical protein